MVTPMKFSIIMEFADDGDLYQKITDRKKRKELFTENEIWSVLIQTVVGLKALHTLNILHRDLKVKIPNPECQYLPYQGRRSKTWRFEC